MLELDLTAAGFVQKGAESDMKIDWDVGGFLAVLSLLGVLLLMVMAIGAQVPFLKE